MSVRWPTLLSVPPLVRHFPTGLAMVQPKVPWYEPTVAYLIVIPAVIVWFLSIPLNIVYSQCLDPVQCSSADLLESTTESYVGIVWSAAALHAVAIICAVVVQLTMRKLHFLIVWAIALLCLGSSVLAYGIISGAVGTPWGQLYRAGVALHLVGGG